MSQTIVGIEKIKDLDTARAIDTLGSLSAAGTIGKVTLTQPATGSTLTIADGKILTVNQSATVTQAGLVLATGATVSATTGLTPTVLEVLRFRTVTGVALAASASAGIFGITYTPGTTANLVTEAANSNTKTDVACIDFILPPNYIAATDITVTTHSHYVLGSGTIGTHTLQVDAYKNAADGTQGATLVATAPQAVPAADGAQTFTITGATLTPGSYLSLKFTMVIQDTGGSNITGQLSSVTLS